MSDYGWLDMTYLPIGTSAGFRLDLSPSGKFKRNGEGRQLAVRVRTTTSTSNDSRSKNPGLDDWPQSGKRYARFED